MRYRIWSVVEQKMIYEDVSSYVSFDDDGTINCSTGMWQDNIPMLQLNEKLWEGDVIESCNRIYEIKWYQEELKYAAFSQDTWYDIPKEYKVIGNIYQKKT